jgi:nicotinamidase-related amidase
MLTINGREVLQTIEELVDPKHTALLVVDVQKDLAYPGGYLDRRGGAHHPMAAVLPNIAEAVQAARQAGVLVVYLHHTVAPDHRSHTGPWIRYYTRGLKYDPDNYGCVENTWGWEICDEVKPQPGDIVVPKMRPSGFVGTPLQLILQQHGVKTVVVCGYATEACVASTVRDALWYEYHSVPLLDCMGSNDPECAGIWLEMLEKGSSLKLDGLKAIWAAKPSASTDKSSAEASVPRCASAG